MEQLVNTNIIRGSESYTFRIIVGELLAWLLFVSCSVMCNVMVPRVCPSQPRWVPHVTGSPWLITIIKWRDLRERQSFPIPGQAVTPCHTSQPPSSAPGRVTEAIRSKVAPRRWEREGQCWWHHHQHHPMQLIILNVKVATVSTRHSILTRLPSLRLGLCSRSLIPGPG